MIKQGVQSLKGLTDYSLHASQITLMSIIRLKVSPPRQDQARALVLEDSASVPIRTQGTASVSLTLCCPLFEVIQANQIYTLKSNTQSGDGLITADEKYQSL